MRSTVTGTHRTIVPKGTALRREALDILQEYDYHTFVEIPKLGSYSYHGPRQRRSNTPCGRPLRSSCSAPADGEDNPHTLVTAAQQGLATNGVLSGWASAIPRFRSDFGKQMVSVRTRDELERSSGKVVITMADERVYRVILEPNDQGGFTVTVPALPAVVTQGDTRAKALGNTSDAIRLYIESLCARGLPIPEDQASVAEVRVTA